jgi:formate dehydrogenase iron-sulfur subunit
MKQPNLIENYLKEQQNVNAVDIFSKKHENSEFPKHQKFYQDLIPKRSAQEGEQFAFQVDLDTCTGCKACVAGCHSMNGLSEDEAWRKTGTIQGIQESTSFSQTLTSACHHCLEPACAQGCPTMSYEKDPVTGIVKHLDDQCFGCRYCELKCPYGVPQFNKDLGIVRKCDMCTERLSAGEAPACVQSCPNGAIAITIVDTKTIPEKSKLSFEKIPNAPESEITLPTTQYVSKRKFTSANTIDESIIHAEHSHMPLVFMLVLTQFSVGAILCATILNIFNISSSNELILASLVLGALGLGIAPLHLGKPHLAYKAFLGFRTSWLSREMLSFGPYPIFIATALIPSYADQIQSLSPITLPDLVFEPIVKKASLIFASLIGIASVFCSAMIYIDTKRVFWKAKSTTSYFTGTVLSTAFLSLFCQLGYFDDVKKATFGILFFVLICFSKLMLDISLKHKKHNELLLTNARKLVEGSQGFIFSTRVCLCLMSGIIIPLAYLSLPSSSISNNTGVLFSLIALGWLISEFCERILFFTLALPKKMPGYNN